MTYVKKNQRLDGNIIFASAFFFVSYAIYFAVDSAFLFYFSCITICISCGYSAIKSIIRREINIGALLSTQTMLWYALPFSYIWFFGYSNYIMLVSERQSADGLFIVIMSSFVCYLVFNFYSHVWRLELGSFSKPRGFIFLVAPIVTVQAVFIALGRRGYAMVLGFGQEAGSKPLVYQFVEGLSPAMLPIICALIGYQFSSKSVRNNYIITAFLIFCAFVQLVWWATEGRRAMTIISIISFVIFFSVYFSDNLTSNRIFVIFISGLIGAMILYIAWQAYFLLRIATSESGAFENLGIFDLERAKDIAASTDVGGSFADNIIIRPFSILISFVWVRELSSGVLLGWNAVSQFLNSIPSFFFEDKFLAVGPVQEDLWAQALGVPKTDYTNTIFLESYVDFGVLGFLIYLVFIIKVCEFVNFICRRAGWSELVVFNYFTILFVVMNVETSPNTFFVYIRSIVFISIIYFILDFIRLRGRSKRKRKVPQP